MKIISASDASSPFEVSDLVFEPTLEIDGNAATGVTVSVEHPPDTTYYSVVIAKGGYHPWHLGPTTGTCVVVRGKGTVYTPAASFQYEAPCLVYIPRDVEHKWDDILEETLVVVAVVPA